ncbi:MAG: competence/damage-inducible protein A [Bryobacterales bacterium]|nr:competence/damage-inducible protein A [Bryobacterales bacterium]
MDAEIIAVGSELLTPARLDTNSLFLTEQLNGLGVEVAGKMVVGDDVGRLAEAVRAAVSRSGIVILTGGLGPTEDDVTREAAARALGRELVYQEDLAARIEQRFRRMDRKMAGINLRQAYLVQGGEPLPNPNGTAPGQWITQGGAVIMLLPGPPPELEPMFRDHCLPRLERLVPKQFIRTRCYRIAGMGESDVDQLVAPVYTKYRNPVTTILAAPGDVQIHLRARCASEQEAERLLAEIGPEIERLLGDRIYSRDGKPLEAVVGDRLRAVQATISVAESCTGGLLAEKITSVAGSSDYFVGGFLVYTNRLKTALAGVPPDLLARHGAVSEPVAEALALGVKARTESTYALAITGVAGPGGGTETKPAGTVVIGLAGPQGSAAHSFRFLGNRARVRALAVQYALDLLRRALA